MEGIRGDEVYVALQNVAKFLTESGKLKQADHCICVKFHQQINIAITICLIPCD